MDLARFARRRYSSGSTPIEELPRLSRFLGGPELYIKRDDLLGFAGGGNKIRKLEFIMADALARKARTVITCGAVQSNHCRLTLAAAVREELGCRLILEERVPKSYRADAGGNNLLFHLMGAEEIKVVPGGSDMMAEMEEVAEGLVAEGKRPYVIPGGAATPLGALGYVRCAQEIMDQSFDSDLPFDYVVCASGTGGTHSGLIAGFFGFRGDIPVIGISVNRSRSEQEERVYRLLCDAGDLLGIKEVVPRASVRCLDDYVGPGYSLPTDGMIEAVRLLARTEALLLDPVYTGKAMAGLIDLVRRGFFKKGQKVLFLHTGGIPGLFAHPGYFLGE